MRRSLLLLLLAMLTMPALAGDISGSITVNGAKRSYLGYVPTNLGENQPLLISCHGMNQDAAYQKGMLDIKSVADAGKFLTIFPEGEGKSWDIGGDKDINFMKKLIDEMVTKYKIDRNRVYLSGFSMGGMFTYHAMNRMPDLIAAFAPISGYSMGGTNINSKVRPLPVIHTHGTGDDVVVFSGVQGAMNALIAHNGCSKTAKVEKKYRNAPHITRHTWSGGKDGVEVVLMEMADKGHWISNDYGVKTGEEIWNFCKRYSLKSPKVMLSSPQDGLTFISFGGAADVGTQVMEATAQAVEGNLSKVEFFDGSKRLASFTEPPYTLTLDNLGNGTHVLKVVATDEEGHTGERAVTINVIEQKDKTDYGMHKLFVNNAGAIPEGWMSYTGSTRRIGYKSGYTSGSRVLQFTGSKHDFVWGLYGLNGTGKTKAGYVRFADKSTTYSMKLYPGSYQLQTRVVSYNQASLPPVTVAVETIDGQEVFSQTLQPKLNIGGKTTTAFSGSKTEKVLFDINEPGLYMITYYAADSRSADFVVGAANLRRVSSTTGISTTLNDKEEMTADDAIYDLNGRRVQGTVVRPGVYIKGGKKVVMR